MVDCSLVWNVYVDDLIEWVPVIWKKKERKEEREKNHQNDKWKSISENGLEIVLIGKISSKSY